MANANHFIKCSKCGSEFLSAFAGAALAFGCVEHCPRCGSPANTPLIFGARNASALEAATKQPMIRQYGPSGSDGYVYMGCGHLSFAVEHPALVSVHAAYDRNINRALELLDFLYEVSTDRKQLILSTVFIATMTAYECLSDDLLGALQELRLATPIRDRANLHERREHLFAALGFKPDSHVKALRYLYAFRNCLTHSAGVVDDEFLKTLKAFGPMPTPLSMYAVGQPLVLEASAATSFADSLQQLADYLLKSAQKLCKAKGI